MGLTELIIGMGMIISIFVSLAYFAADEKTLEKWRKSERR